METEVEDPVAETELDEGVTALPVELLDWTEDNPEVEAELEEPVLEPLSIDVKEVTPEELDMEELDMDVVEYGPEEVVETVAVLNDVAKVVDEEGLTHCLAW